MTRCRELPVLDKHLGIAPYSSADLAGRDTLQEPPNHAEKRSLFHGANSFYAALANADGVRA